MDRVDKVLLIFPLLPLADLLSTLFSLSMGGVEVGILAQPILTHYGPFGLVLLAASASIMFLFCMKLVIYIKELFVKELRFRWMSYILIIPLYWFFVLEGVYVSTVVLNFLVPLALSFSETIVLKALLLSTYFACVSWLTKPQMMLLPRG